MYHFRGITVPVNFECGQLTACMKLRWYRTVFIECLRILEHWRQILEIKNKLFHLLKLLPQKVRWEFLQIKIVNFIGDKIAAISLKTDENGL